MPGSAAQTPSPSSSRPENEARGEEERAMCQIVPAYRGRRVSDPEERASGLDRRDFLKLAGGAAAVALTAASPTWAQNAKVEVHWLGQAATKLTTLTGKVI